LSSSTGIDVIIKLIESTAEEEGENQGDISPVLLLSLSLLLLYFALEQLSLFDSICIIYENPESESLSVH